MHYMSLKTFLLFTRLYNIGCDANSLNEFSPWSQKDEKKLYSIKQNHFKQNKTKFARNLQFSVTPFPVDTLRHDIWKLILHLKWISNDINIFGVILRYDNKNFLDFTVSWSFLSLHSYRPPRRLFAILDARRFINWVCLSVVYTPGW